LLTVPGETFGTVGCSRPYSLSFGNDALRARRGATLVGFIFSSTTAISAFPIEGGPPAHIEGKPVNRLLGWFLTYPFNMTGNPVASMPCGTDPNGLPIGMQLVGKRFDDALVLRACRAFQDARPWGRPTMT
jgi:Asp-tRNA(Asn)/Glu-tRNA(Gln) amidotransferase A subunit family amidase